MEVFLAQVKRALRCPTTLDLSIHGYIEVAAGAAVVAVVAVETGLEPWCSGDP